MISLKKIINLFILSLLSAFIVYFYLHYKTDSNFIIANIRVPRLILAITTGMILSGVGSTYQVLLNNPLADPYILGISSGAALGSTIAAILGFYIFMPIFGFAGAFLATILVWIFAHSDGYFNKTRLLLSGIIIGMLFSSIISLLMYLNQREIGNIINVLMGNLGHIFSKTEWIAFKLTTFIASILMIYLFSLSRKLNIMTTGDLIAGSLGIDVKKIRHRTFIVCSLLTAITVSYAGIIGFVGLIVPHLSRMIIGNEQKNVFILSSILGGILVILCDFIAMHLTAIELPVGVVTSFVGTPMFLLIMLRNK